MPGVLDFLVLTPTGAPEPSLAIAASRAGAIGTLDLRDAADEAQAAAALQRLSAAARGRWAVAVQCADGLPSAVRHAAPPGLEAVVICGRGGPLGDLVGEVQALGARALVQALSLEDARAAEEAGADAVIATGHEAGGWIGEEGAFVLLQRCTAELSVPVWAHGGVGLHTAAACAVAGAAGAVLDSQVLLARESPLPAAVRKRVAAMDGSETACPGRALGAPFRLLSRPDLDGPRELERLAARLEAEADEPDAERAWRAELHERVAWDDRPGGVLAIGQDGAFAAELARRFVTVGGILAALATSVREQLAAARARNPLARDAGLAAAHGTEYPIVQGPMTRVSDRAEFAAAVADAGALPFLALALLRGPEVADLLRRTREELGERPWGVGILGFVPAALRAEQLEAVRAVRPPFALIAGGRPDQARVLEQDGTTTYLHVPSEALLRMYLRDGARRFVFEGRECGGHVGPRTSFVLWESMVDALLDALPAGAGPEVSVLFAGGIHDGRSAAMTAAIAAPLAERGVRIGVLMGTAYLYTEEAVSGGAITAAFQQAAVAGDRTVLLESGPGQATRCLPSPFVDDFAAERLRLMTEEVAPAERRDRLEQLNIGRLRIAAKGVDRNPAFAGDPQAPKLVEIDDAEQWRQGLFMIGQVAAMHDRVGTIAELHERVIDGAAERLATLPTPDLQPEPAPEPAEIAIIGVGSILPGASDARTFWENVVGGVDAVTEIPDTRWDWRRYFDAERSAPDRVYSRWGGFVDDVEFDPLRFGMPPNTLASIEPFQLLGLLAAQAAIEDAGYGERPFPRERTSVMFGAGGGGGDLAVGYTVRSALPSLLGDRGEGLIDELGERLPQWTEDSFPGLLMNVAAGRIANRLDLGGANFTVDAACGSSLAAVTLAVRDLQSGLSDMAVVGGVDAIQNPFAYLCFAKTQALSPGGRCRPFDAGADGIAISEGFAAVILKRLADAERDGDRVYAVIRGVGAASDGRDRSLTAPRPEGQMLALRRAYAQARISPAEIGLVEAHGTGTVAGDRAEIAALQTVFDEAGAERQQCAIGSVKSMIGHTKATAGVASLVKTALALHHRVLPPTLGVETPNPRTDFPSTPFYPNVEARPWVRAEGAAPRRAGVSAFGFGGTNFHVVLEEHADAVLPDAEACLDRWPAELLVWRRDTPEELAEAVDGLLARLEAGAQPVLADLALTLAEELPGGPAARPALAIVAEDLDDLRRKLVVARGALGEGAARVHQPAGVYLSLAPLAGEGELAFLFPGQGSQVVGMGRELALAFPEARRCLERADAVLAGCHPQPLSRHILPPPAFTDEERASRLQELTRTDVAQPALGAVELGYLHVLRALGVTPGMTAGHSYGEFVALAAAGGLGEDDLLRVSEARGRFIREESDGESGAMAAVAAGPEALGELAADPELVLANLNGPQQTVLSGSTAAIERSLQWCREHDLSARRLPVACGFHSPYVAAAQRRLAGLLEQTPLATPDVPVFSNTTASPHSEDPAEITATLARHLVEPVAFADEIAAMHAAGARIFLEVGPRNVLTGLVDRILGERPHVAVAVDQGGRSGLVQLAHALAALAVEGVELSLQRLFSGRRVARLNPRTLEPLAGRPPRSPATWLVNGGRARPASRSLSPVSPLPPPTVSEVPMTHANGAQSNGHHDHDDPPISLASASATAPTPSPAPAPALPRTGGPGGLDGERAGEVMTRHHQVMQHFLETQKSVMLAYLGQRRGASLRPDAAAAPPPPARPALGRPSSAPAPAAVAEVAAPPGATAPVAGDATPPPAAAPVAEDAASSAAPAADRAAPPADSGAAPPDIAGRLLEVVSERTGYPPDLLDLDADLESDLGVDSIKRVEIAGTMMQDAGMPEDAELDVEELTASRTLRQVIGVLERLASGAPAPEPVAAGGDGGQPVPLGDEPVDGRIGRFVLQTAGAPAVARDAGLDPDGVAVIVGDGGGIAEALAERLSRDGRRAVVVPTVEAAAAVTLIEDVRRHEGPVTALVHLAALAREAPPDLGTLLALTQALREDLERAAGRGGAAVLGATRLDGAFGIEAPDEDLDPRAAVIPGFLKSLAHEWPDVRVKAVDLGLDDPEVASERLLDELLAGDGLVEVGYRHGHRIAPCLVPAPTERRESIPPLEGASVVLVTGGARGITAEIAIDLAHRYGPTLVLAGRTPPPPEEDDLGASSGERELQQAIIERRRAAGETLTPRAVRDELRSRLAAREVRDTLRRLRAAGARATYVACDVQDPGALGALVESIYAEHGRLDGVVHGAGVIEDRLVRDKELASLERVLATKAGSALTLAERLRPEGLRFLVLFSSVSARFGNRGQADYAAASEVLNKLAQQLDRRWDARVVAVNWGPWAGTGMVSPEVARQFAERGVALIPLDVGCARLDEELRRGRKGEVEVLIGGAEDVPAAVPKTRPPARRPTAAFLRSPSAITRREGAQLEVIRALEPEHDRLLDDHRLDGKAVLPFTGAVELMAETALTAYPELELRELRDVRLHDGVTVTGPSVAVRVLASPGAPGDDGAAPDGTQIAEVTIDTADARRARYRAVAVLGPRLDTPGATGALVEPLDHLSPSPITARQAYEEYLFHGPLFHHIEAIEGLDARGAVAVLSGSDPAEALRGAGPESAWILDPVVLDCALQVQLLWGRTRWDMTLLPVSAAAVRRHAPAPPPGSAIRHELRVRPASRAPMCVADHRFLAEDGTLLVEINGMQGAGSRALNRLARVPA